VLFEQIKKDSVALQSTVETLELNEKHLLEEQSNYEQKLQQANDDMYSRQSAHQARLAEAEVQNRVLTAEVYSLTTQLSSSQNELAGKQRAHAAELKRIADTSAQDLENATKNLEDQAALLVRSKENESTSLKHELEYFKQKSQESQRNVSHFEADRRQYEQDLQELRQRYHEASGDLENVEATFEAYKAHSENKFRSLKSEYDLKLRENIQRELSNKRRQNLNVSGGQLENTVDSELNEDDDFSRR